MSNIILTTTDELENLIQKSVRKIFNEQVKDQSQEEKTKFLTIKEAGEFLHLAEQTIYGYTSKGLIPYQER